jgi:hypothetical protein
MAALPAYVGASSFIVAYSSPDYDRRAWCQLELVMSYAFMGRGDILLSMGRGFRHDVDRPVRVAASARTSSTSSTSSFRRIGQCSA